MTEPRLKRHSTSETIRLIDKVDDGLEEFRVVKESANINGTKDSRIVGCKLEWSTQMLPCWAMDKEMSSGLVRD
jgi:hypothetical protein